MRRETVEVYFETLVGNVLVCDADIAIEDCECTSDYGDSTATERWTETHIEGVYAKRLEYGGGIPDLQRERLEDWFEGVTDWCIEKLQSDGLEAHQ